MISLGGVRRRTHRIGSPLLSRSGSVGKLTANGYHYQFVFAEKAEHTDRAVKAQTLPEALEYVWAGYRVK